MIHSRTEQTIMLIKREGCYLSHCR